MVAVRHNRRNEPDEAQIEKEIDWWAKRGYELARRSEKPVGLLTSLLNFWARGQTDLRFEKKFTA